MSNKTEKNKDKKTNRKKYSHALTRAYTKNAPGLHSTFSYGTAPAIHRLSHGSGVLRGPPETGTVLGDGEGSV